jgi:FAD/FMN-containing dehydrogenase
MPARSALSRREFLAAAAAVPLGGCIARPLPVRSVLASAIPDREASLIVNDIHSQLNATRVAAIVKPSTLEELAAVVRAARDAGKAVCVAGGRHAMGGQQFRENAVLLDTRGLNRILDFDEERGTIDVEGGIQWPELIGHLNRVQDGRATSWGIYGLFGIVTRVGLRLRPRVKVRRVVALGETAGIMERFEERIRDGYMYGDYQFTTDATRDSFLRRGVFSCYQPVADDVPLTANPARFHPEDWARLTFYSHMYKRRAFEVYSSRYLKTSGQIYWSDSQLSAAYVDGYHADLDRALGSKVKATEMITELYVPRHRLAAFMEDTRTVLRDRRANVIYGTVRLIEKDEESFLAWARERWACVIFNLHVEHTQPAMDVAAESFRALIDLAVAHDGSYYLTYHRWARREQVLRCYPQMTEFLVRKRMYDPDELFQSTWYLHYRDVLM